jgi:predicted amidohydrolase
MALNVALIQMDVKWEYIEENNRRASALLEKAAGKGCDVAVLPEMFTTGFTMNLSEVEGVTSPSEGKTARFLSETAKRLGIYIIAGVAVKPENKEKGLNLAMVYNREGQQIASYTKNRPFPLLEEEKYFDKGVEPVVFELDGVPASVFICFDLRFPELFRAVAGKAMAMFVIANWPSKRAEHWTALLRARAIENQCYIIGLNRIGTDGNRISYSGYSSVYDPMGKLISWAGEGEEILMARIDPEEALSVRKEYPFLPIDDT